MHKLLTIPALGVALMLSSCTFESAQSRSKAGQASIWERAGSRYGSQPSSTTPVRGGAAMASRPSRTVASSSGTYRTYTGVRQSSSNRVAPPASRPPLTEAGDRRLTGPTISSSTSSRSVANNNSFGSPVVSESAPALPPALPQRREPITSTNSNSTDRLSSTQRSVPQPPPVSRPPAAPAPEPPAAPPTAPPAAPNYDSLPFATPVAGKSGYVKLPGANLPEIDVRGIAPGTPVEIPNPNAAGETIQFRVP